MQPVTPFKAAHHAMPVISNDLHTFVKEVVELYSSKEIRVFKF